MDAVERAGRRPLSPQRVDQAVRRDDFPDAQKKDGEQRPPLGRSEVENLPAFSRLKGTQDAELPLPLRRGQPFNSTHSSSIDQAQFKHRKPNSSTAQPAPYVIAQRSGTPHSSTEQRSSMNRRLRRTAAALVALAAAGALAVV